MNMQNLKQWTLFRVLFILALTTSSKSGVPKRRFPTVKIFRGVLPDLRSSGQTSGTSATSPQWGPEGENVDAKGDDRVPGSARGEEEGPLVSDEANGMVSTPSGAKYVGRGMNPGVGAWYSAAPFDGYVETYPGIPEAYSGIVEAYSRLAEPYPAFAGVYPAFGPGVGAAYQGIGTSPGYGAFPVRGAKLGVGAFPVRGANLGVGAFPGGASTIPAGVVFPLGSGVFPAGGGVVLPVGGTKLSGSGNMHPEGSIIIPERGSHMVFPGGEAFSNGANVLLGNSAFPVSRKFLKRGGLVGNKEHDWLDYSGMNGNFGAGMNVRDGLYYGMARGNVIPCTCIGRGDMLPVGEFNEFGGVNLINKPVGYSGNGGYGDLNFQNSVYGGTCCLCPTIV